MISRPTLVTGATGKTGSRIVARLEDRNHNVRYGSRGAPMPFEWERPHTWGPVLEGVTAAYVCYYPDFAFPGALDTLAAFSEAARAAGVGRLVMITGRGESQAQRGEDIVTDIARETFDGRNAHISDGVERALGRRPRDFTQFALNAARVGAWTAAA